MPTPVGIARQCLTQEASSALDEAVAVARRRSHSQTTSLHLISAFLSFPTSSLRDACSRVRSSAYAPRFQFKALELCFGSALDRLPSSQQSSNNESDPPISNSLMAAIKRSQAHQRRNPESFHLYQQQQQQNSSLSCVKVEVQQLVLSILDDPIVSRVFAEAGFRSCDIKLAILRPLPPLSRFQRSRRAPLFLCNLTEGGDSDFAARNFNFPFLGCSGFPESSEGDENFRRIGEVLARKKERNPLLVGVYANQALRSFSEIVQRGRAGSVPAELSGLSLLSIEKEIHNFISQGGSEGLSLGAKFEELHHLIGNCSGPGVVLSFGDLSVLLDDNSIDSVGYVISQLSKLSELHPEKLWLMGAVASYEMYLKFLMMFPSIDKDWDLQILPITSLKTTTPPLGGFQSRPQSLMESFVPFGGFFSTTSDMSSPFTSTYQPISRCHLCNEKYEQEVSAFSNGGCTPSVADQYNASLPSWLQKGEVNASKGFDMTQAKDDGTVFNAKVTGLQKKWNDICRRLHHCPAITKDDYRVRPQVVSGAMGFPFLSDRKDDANSLSSSSDILRAVPNKNDCENAQPSTSIESHKISSPTQKTPEPLVSEAKSENFSCKTTRTECSRTENPRFPPFPFPSVNSSCDNPSPSTTIPVTTDLGLGTLYASTCKEPVKLTQTDKDWLQKSPDVARPNISNPSIQSPSCSGAEQVDPHDVKSLWRCLMDKVGRQNEAIHTISQTISRCRTGNERRRGASLKRDVWFSFIGLDRVAKRRTVLALAEVVFGRKQNVISVDLSSQDGLTHSNTVFGCREVNGDDAKFRGKMVVDYIAEEISKKPLSIVFLENINKADMLLQNSLSLAIKTGKFSDSRGREVSVNNTIFVATSSAAKDTTSPSVEENTCTKYSEERILKAQNLEMQILIGNINGDDNIKMKFSNVLVTSKKETRIPSFLNKRKLVEGSDVSEKGDWLGRAKKTPKCLDLNLPVNETETIDLEYDSSESDAGSENSEMWLEEFLAQMDGSVMFKPFDFDTLANTLLKEINAVVRSTVGPDCVVEIDSQVMEQILAASWLSDRERAAEDWVQQILGKSFIEAQQRYAFTSQSVLKLVTCDDQYVRDQAHGVCLPSRIIVNL